LAFFTISKLLLRGPYRLREEASCGQKMKLVQVVRQLSPSAGNSNLWMPPVLTDIQERNQGCCGMTKEKLTLEIKGYGDQFPPVRPGRMTYITPR
jgi:hypothetical protein